MSDNVFEKEYLSIKEFAELVGMTASSLRHYDTAGAFPPAKRGIEFGNNYRFYSPTQVTAVNMIRVLTEIGVHIDTIKELANDRTPEKLLKLFRRHRDMTADKIKFLQEAHLIISTFADLLCEAIGVTEAELSVTEMPETSIILGDIADYSGTVGFIREFTRFCNDVHEPMLNLSYPIGAYFESMAAFLTEPSQPTRFFSLDPKGNEKKSAGLFLVGYTRGYYGQVNDLPKRMSTFAKKNGLVFSGPVYNIYLTDEVSVMDSEQYLLQASAPVMETRRTPSRRPHSKF